MTFAWSGSDPTQSSDSGSYSLASTFVANQAITVSGIRVWEGATPGMLATRNGRLWTTSGTQLAIASMPSTLPSGWSEYSFVSPVNLTVNEQATIAYDTGGFYGQLNHAFDSAVNSADGAVTFLAGSSAPHGNGSFTTSVGSFPNVAASQNTFYGVDIVYTLTGGNTPPTISGMTAVVAGATVTSTINAVGGTAGLSGATYKWDWGDGTTTSGSASTASHTYTASGAYAVLGSVTDTANLSAVAARPVFVVLPASGFDAQGLTDALASMALASGLFAAVSGHEPLSLPGANEISAAVWMQGIGPAKDVSGLAATAARVEYLMRLYTPMVEGNMDAIDPLMTRAASQMIGLLTADFTLGGEVFAADVLGAWGRPVSAKADYYKQGDSFYRIYDITVPLIVDNVWAQGAVS